MGWTRGKDTESPGKFCFELFDGFQTVERRGGFDTPQEADRAAEIAQRRWLFGAREPELDAMTVDEIWAALSDELAPLS